MVFKLLPLSVKWPRVVWEFETALKKSLLTLPSTETWCSIVVVVNLGNPLPFCQREQRELFIELLSSLSTLFEYLASTSKKHYGRPQHYYCHACPTLKTNFVLVQSISIGSDKCYLSSSVPLQITNANITSIQVSFLCIDIELRRQQGVQASLD